uniref:Uncharacterized protein n=1 Tax=Triticum urartu TaxID=4572 RepID=A0A8R7QZF1_TRIUA
MSHLLSKVYCMNEDHTFSLISTFGIQLEEGFIITIF